MRAVLQRVQHGQVSVDDQVVSALPRPGIVALIGVRVDDDETDAEYIARKIAELRILADEQSATDVGAPILVISQFTLYASTKKGRRPSWNQAARGEIAQPLIAHLEELLRARGLEVLSGQFGANMQVELVNDGPVTIILDSREK